MLIDYRWLQSAAALRRLERQNFREGKARMQWWYVDAVMNDGRVVLVAFVPKKWWRDVADASLDDAFLFVAMAGGDGTSRSISRTLDASRLRSAEDGLGLEIPGVLTIARAAGDPATYRWSFDVDEVQGALEVRSLARPFSPFPRGTLPGLGRAALLGGRLGTAAFSYVAQVPRGTIGGTLTMGGERIAVDGHAYHEQGRFDDPPERLSKGWFWCHFLHPEWNVFGSPGVFLYVQRRQDPPIFSGFNLFDR